MDDIAATPASAREALTVAHRLTSWRLPPAVAGDADAQQVAPTKNNGVCRESITCLSYLVCFRFIRQLAAAACGRHAQEVALFTTSGFVRACGMYYFVCLRFVCQLAAAAHGRRRRLRPAGKKLSLRDRHSWAKQPS